MARKTSGGIGAYNATIAAIKAKTGVSHKEAQQAYRGASAKLGRAPTAKEARQGGVVAQEARRAGRAIAERKAADMRAVERANERARLSVRELKARDKAAAERARPGGPGRGPGADRGGGGGGGGGGAAPGGGGPGPGAGPQPTDWSNFEDYGEYEAMEYDTEGDY